MTSLPDQPPPSKPKRWAPCPLCERTVTTADVAGGGKMVVERCPDDRGNIGLTDPLFEGGPLLAVHGIVSRYRAHCCRGALASTPAFSAGSFDRKRARRGGDSLMATSAPIPGFVSRVAANLEAEPLADLMRLTAILLENARELIAGLGSAEAAADIDAVYKPFVRVLLLRALELEHHPPSRGNA